MAKLIKVSFIIAVVCSITAMILKLNYHIDFELILILQVIPCLIFIIPTIIEVNNSNRISRGEKIMWTVGLLFMWLIAGIVYITAGRKRIAQSYSE